MEALRAVVHWVAVHRFWSLFGTLIIVAAIGFYQVVAKSSQGELSAPLQRGMIVDSVYGIGTVTATHTFSIRPGTIGTITELYVKEGDMVRKGARLASIDRVVYSAPFDGTVNYLPFKVGENIFSQIPTLSMVYLPDRYLVVTLEQQSALRVRPGQRAKLSFDSIRQQNYDGIVKSVYSYNSTFLARIDVNSLPAEILPDMTADIAIVIRELQNALLLPVNAFENGSVWVKQGRGIPYKVAVKLGVVDGSVAEVVAGDLKEGDRVMIRKKVAP